MGEAEAEWQGRWRWRELQRRSSDSHARAKQLAYQKVLWLPRNEQALSLFSTLRRPLALGVESLRESERSVRAAISGSHTPFDRCSVWPLPC